MYYEDATRKQLLQIALHEDCSIDDKYEAVRELQLRQFTDDMLPDLVKLWGAGLSTFEVGIELGIPQSTVIGRLQKYNLYGKRVIA